MNDILRTFRLGVVNLLGVTVPGFILLFLLLIGFLAPSVLFVHDLASRAPSLTLNINSAGITNSPGAAIQIQPASTNQTAGGSTNMPAPTVVSGEQQLISTVRNLPPLGPIPGFVVLAIALILAYVIGYIFRLSTPDELDIMSAKLVLAQMEVDRRKEAGGVKEDAVQEGNEKKEGAGLQSAAAVDVWPYQGEKDNKFPYLHFKQYLAHRQHGDLAKHVKWGYPCDEQQSAGSTQNSEGKSQVRSKTFVNLMKIETSLRCPQLSGIIESDEAHIRMLYGTWLACRICRVFLVFGFLAAVIGSVMSACKPGLLISHGELFTSYLIWASFTILLLVGAFAGKWQIEKLFHYRRVRELFDVVACYDLARKGFGPAGQPLPLSPANKQPEGK